MSILDNVLFKTIQGYNPNLKASSSSFEGKANNEYKKVQATSGEGYVPDPAANMSLTTLQINLIKIDKWIAHYSKQPVPDNLNSLYEKEASGKGQSITSVVKNILVYLENKRQLYVAYMNSAAGVGTVVPSGVNTPATVNTSEPNTEVPGTGSVDHPSGLASAEEKPMSKKVVLIAGGLLLAAILVVVIVKSRK